jgi:hypothetical protein
MHSRVILAALISVLVGCSASLPPVAETARPVPAELIVHSKGTSMIPYFTDGEWVGLLLVDYDSLQPGQSCIYWHKETRQYVHHFTHHFDVAWNAWVMQGSNNTMPDSGRMTRAAFVGRTVVLPKQPKF